MFKILIFGGTTEGRELAEFCHNNRISAAVCVTTEFGKELLSSYDSIEIFTGKKDYRQIINILKREKFSLVLDATHPFAESATENIKKACEYTNTKNFRIIRANEIIEYKKVKYFNSISDAAEYADTTKGNILVTTGSKNLAEYTVIKNFSERIFVRILPDSKFINECFKLGFKKKNIISEIGPFSAEQNCCHIKDYNIDIIVTKESGKIGGFSDKITAAQLCDCEVLIISKPIEYGYSIEEMKKLLMRIKDEQQ